MMTLRLPPEGGAAAGAGTAATGEAPAGAEEAVGEDLAAAEDGELMEAFLGFTTTVGFVC
jgi:hypothetical protein